VREFLRLFLQHFEIFYPRFCFLLHLLILL